MSTVLTPPTRTPPAVRSGLTSRRLPDWAPLGAAAAGLAAGLALAVVRGSVNPVPVVVVAWLVATTLLVGASLAVEGRRRATDRGVTAAVYGAFVLAMLPLAGVLAVVVARGLERLDVAFFTQTMRGVGPREAEGGALHAIIATLEQVTIASLIAIPLGVLVAIYLVEYGRGRFARATSYIIDVMTGLPSVVAGLFILASWVLVLRQGFSGFAGALALAILMLPVVTRSSEEMLKLVPDALREAAFALGVPRWRTILKVVLPTALPGMITGIMLAVARVFGETAPILLVTFGNANLNLNPFDGAQSSLPLFIYEQARQPNETAIDRAWAAALTLILIVLLLNVVARVIASRGGARSGR